MPSSGASKNSSGGSFRWLDVRFHVTRNALTMLAPNTIVSPNAVDWARARLLAPNSRRTVRMLPVRDSVGSRFSNASMYRANSEWLALI